jgi:glycine/D-amino acid oxidase-like deaminating enzyme
MAARAAHPWGRPPWKIDFRPARRSLPAEADFAVIGGGFTGLAAAAWLRHLDSEKSVAVLEAGRIGAGASGRTGGLVLGETAAGDKPGLGDVLAGFRKILRMLGVECELALPGVWEIARRGDITNSPIEWEDSGTLGVAGEVPGGSLDPGKLVSGLGRAASRLGAQIFERCGVQRIRWPRRAGVPIEIMFPRGRLRARKVLLATNALSLSMSKLSGRTQPRLTLAVLTSPVSDEQIEAAGLVKRKPFYTVDLPYLWGRLRGDNSIVWGAGLLSAPRSRGLERLSIRSAEPRRLFAELRRRVRGLHRAFRQARFTHEWGGPILFRENWTPVFDWHPESGEGSHNGIVLGAYAGHGVALSSYLGAWAAEALLEKRDLPRWGRFER